MFECKNRIEVVGKVRNFKIKELEKSHKKLANISIKDEKKNNFINVTLFDREGMKYGKKNDSKDVTLGSLKKIFLDSEDKPKDVLITAVGITSEYTNDEGNTYSNNTVFQLYPCDDEEKQKATFVLQGIVESISTGQDDDENEYVKMKLGMYSTSGKDKEKKITGVNYKTVMVHDQKLVEKLEDAEKGDLVSAKGYIINTLPERDEFGDLIGQGKQEYEVVKGSIVKASDELDEDDVKVYKKAKKLTKGESIKFPSKKDDDFDEDEDLD